jgi:hypothetical protein
MISKAQRKALFNLPEIYIISYPKSGRTWLRVLLGKWLSLQYNQQEDLILHTAHLSALCHLPVISFNHDGTEIEWKKSYKDLRADKSRYQDKRIILLVRDIRDTLVSAYFHATRRDQLFKGSLSQFIRSQYFGARKILTFYRHWCINQTTPRDMLTLYYEDMHDHPAAVLTRVLHFIGITEVDPDITDRAVEYASFDHMQQMEKDRRFNYGLLQPGNSDDPQSFKVRQGRVGGYTDHLSPRDIDYIRLMEMKWGGAFTRFSRISP